MGKHKKLTAEPSSATDSDELDLAEQSIRAALAVANAEIETGNAATQILREVAGLTGKLISLAGERRAREKARIYTIKNIPRAVVIAWLREQSDDERGLIVREVAAMAAGGSVLG
jgi:hypothetical protein